MERGTNGFVYLNGVEDNTGTLAQIPQNSAYLPTVGNVPRETGAVLNFNGTLDEVRLYNRGFSAAEVKQLYFSNLSKYAHDKWLYQVAESNLVNGAYTYQATEVSGGVTNQTETRTLNVDVP